MLDVGWMLDGWMDGWLEKAELKPTQPSLAGAWQKQDVAELCKAQRYNISDSKSSFTKMNDKKKPV